LAPRARRSPIVPFASSTRCHGIGFAALNATFSGGDSGSAKPQRQNLDIDLK